MTTVFVSGCYDILHGGHIAFFRAARRLGDRLVVCAASDDVIRQHKGCEPAMPGRHRMAVLEALEVVDQVLLTALGVLGLDFERRLRGIRPDILAVTEDDQFAEAKKKLCDEVGVRYVELPKTAPLTSISTTEIRAGIAGHEMDIMEE